MSGLTQKRLKEVLHYNSRTGIFHWLKSGTGRRLNLIAGTPTTKGYIAIGIEKKYYRAHRLAWLYVKGVWPTDQIDHKDTIRNHNWFSNLREVTHTGNQQNQIKAHSNNKSTGVLGVNFDKHSGKYQAKISVSGKQIILGLFTTLKEAKGIYVKAKREYHSMGTL
jgi:hypothetical protein